MKTSTRLAMIVAALAMPGTVHAGGFAVGQQTVVSSGTGGAGAARDGDPGAAWHNPAALADGGGWRVGLSLMAARASLEARSLETGATAWSTSNETAWSTPPHLDVSVARGRWAAGLALGVPFGSGVAWPSDWVGRHEAVRSGLQVFRAAPFVAWRFGRVRVSGGVHLDAGRLEVERGLDFIDTEGRVRIAMNGAGAGLDAAVYIDARPDLSLGLAYRSRTTLAMRGGANFTAPDAFSEKTADQHAESDVTLPDQLVLGTRWRRGAWAALADVELTLWGVNQQMVVDFEREQTPDAVQDNRWQHTLAVRAGGEHVRGRATLRAGAYFDQAATPADRLAPSSPDASRLAATFGGSYQMTRTLSADVFAESLWLLRREATNQDALAASYGGHAWVFGAGVRWTR